MASRNIESVTAKRLSENVIEYRIESPDVTQREHIVDEIFFKPGDEIEIVDAGGCAQTGGHGKTWKKFVEPTGAGSDKYFYGLIKIPGCIDTLVAIKLWLGKKLPSTKNIDPNGVHLFLGYEDDDYTDNGYWGRDSGNDCDKAPNAFIVIRRKLTLPPGTSLKTPNGCLKTDYPNPPDPTNKDWSAKIANNKIFLRNESPKWAWTPILNPDNEYDSNLVGLSGTVVHSKNSPSDLPFTHPFGNDWECFVALDTPYLPLIGPSNKGPEPPSGIDPNIINSEGDYDYRIAMEEAKDLGLDAQAGVLGIEWDQGLIQQKYRPAFGDRVAIFGRWIVDCGHDDFHTEIHPPLLLARAQAFPGIKEPDTTQSNEVKKYFDIETKFTGHTTLISRPYLVSQEFGDGALRNHLINEIKKLLTIGSSKVEANPLLLSQPFKGDHKVWYTIDLPSELTPNRGLFIRYNFIVRKGVKVYLKLVGSSSIKITVTFNEAEYAPAVQPTIEKVNFNLDELSEVARKDAQEVENTVKFLVDSLSAGTIVFGGGLGPLALVDAIRINLALSNGYGTLKYANPLALSNNDEKEKILILKMPEGYNNLEPVYSPAILAMTDYYKSLTENGISVGIEDNLQPFPIYGYLDIYGGIPIPESFQPKFHFRTTVPPPLDKAVDS